MSETRTKIARICQSLQALLIAKNDQYGDAALSPLHIFSKLNSSNSICNRLDDKLSRIQHASHPRKNDVVDLLGYLVLYCISQDWTDLQKEERDHA